MTTTRHLVNHRRRVLNSAAAATAPAPATAPPRRQPQAVRARDAEPRRPLGFRIPLRVRLRRPSARLLTVLLTAVALACGGFAAYAGTATARIDSTPARQNTALTDTVATSELTGQLTSTIDDLFSYNYTDPSASSSAQQRLTGSAVRQYQRLLAPVRASGAKEKLVLTTTVTYSGVELLHGDHARVLLYADQRSTRTDTSATDYGAAMLAVDAVRRGARWLISDIDTYSG